jgi:enoyl-CoA hydratase
MGLEGIRIEENDRIVQVVIDRPPVNAVSTAMYESLISLFKALGGRADIDVVLLRSANEKIFAAGADIRELEQIVNSGTSELDERRQALARTTYELLIDLPQPTIAVIGGIALGAGAVLNACCDMRVASSKARIGLTEINVARCGGGRHLMRLLPQGVVRRMYFTGEPVDAETLHRFGVFDEIHAPGTELEAALDLARTIAKKSPSAVRIAKEALNASEPRSIAEGYPIEQEYTLRLARSQDAKEAARAFLDKREPVWTGS